MPVGTMSLKLISACAALLIGSAAAFADPPGRVGRLSYMEGVASFRTPDQDQWSPATLNYPVTAGESFWTEPDARVEIQVGSSEIRMDGTTLLDIVALDDGATRLQVDQGVVNVHLRTMPPGGVQVLTPRGELDLVQPGSYHIDAGQPDGNAPPDRTEVTVLEGRATTNGPRSVLEILPGETAVIAGEPQSFTLQEGNSTPFDDWALMRERREAAVEASRYVSPEATGYRDLDSYGRWNTDPTYGAVWYPTAVAAGWAPYRYGHWAYVAPWGWTWIDDAPWGFTPFHYGRWVVINDRWAWVPGTVVPRPVYAPALVAFVGGAGWGVTISTGAALAAVGWVPLAPSEVYHPYYRTSVDYVRNVNVTNVNRTVINNITNVNVTNTVVVNKFVNQQAATVVPAAAFTRAAPVQKATVAVPREQLAQVQVAPSLAHLQPPPAAKAGVAQPAAAQTLLPRPNAPATVAAKPVPVQAPASTHAAVAEPSVPKAPGPSLRARTAPPAAPRNANIASPKPPTAPAPPAAPNAPAKDLSAAHTPPRAAPPSAPAPGPAAPPHQAAATPPKAPPASNPPAAPKPPAAVVQRPVQQTRLAPTPSGWVRAPAAPHPESAAHKAPPKEAAHPPNPQAHPGNEHKPNNQ